MNLSRVVEVLSLTDEHISTSIECGKSGLSNGEFHAAVAAGGAVGPGHLYRAAGLSSLSEVKWQRLQFDRDERSGSKRSGSIAYELTRTGVYRAQGYAEDNRRSGACHFYVDAEAGKAIELDQRQALMLCHYCYPQEVELLRAKAQEEEARRRQLHDARQTIANEYERRLEVLKTSYGADATFTISSSSVGHENAVSAIARRGLSPMEAVQSDCSVRVTAFRDCGHEETLDTAICDAEAIASRVERRLETPCRACSDAARLRAAAEAAAAATAHLPALTGTPRQVEWANRIRAAFAAREPSSALLKRAVRAAYWIDNYKHLLPATRLVG